MANKQELLNFLDRKVFDPILHAKPEDHGKTQGDELAEVQEKTKAEKDRFYHCGSAEQVIAMYKDDLSSEKAKPVNAQLHNLGLSRLVDVKDEFLKLAGETE